MSSPKISLIIPAYNEEVMIDASLTEIIFWVNQNELQDSLEVVVCVQGDDRTKDIAAKYSQDFKHFQLLTPDGAGKGRNVAAGMLAARGEYRIFSDADLATPLEHIPKMVEKLEAGDDVVIGIRNIRTMHDDFVRRVSSRLSNMIIQAMVAPGITDSQCGFKGFKSETAERIFGQLTIFGWGFDFEVLAMVRRSKYRLGTIKIDDWSDPKGENGLTGESQAAAMLKTLRELFKVRINLWKRIYK